MGGFSDLYNKIRTHAANATVRNKFSARRGPDQGYTAPKVSAPTIMKKKKTPWRTAGKNALGMLMGNRGR